MQTLATAAISQTRLRWILRGITVANSPALLVRLLSLRQLTSLVDRIFAKLLSCVVQKLHRPLFSSFSDDTTVILPNKAVLRGGDSTVSACLKFTFFPVFIGGSKKGF